MPAFEKQRKALTGLRPTKYLQDSQGYTEKPCLEKPKKKKKKKKKKKTKKKKTKDI